MAEQLRVYSNDIDEEAKSQEAEAAQGGSLARLARVR